MVVIARGARPWPTAQQLAMRRAHVRAGWSPWERRERAREAAARLGALWRVIHQGDSTVER